VHYVEHVMFVTDVTASQLWTLIYGTVCLPQELLQSRTVKKFTIKLDLSVGNCNGVGIACEHDTYVDI